MHVDNNQARTAAEALAEITRSADALLRFRAAYTGERDGVDVLRRIAEQQVPPTRDSAARVDELLRAAFSRTLSPEEEELAATARDELETIERREADDAAALVAARALLSPAEPAQAAAPSSGTASLTEGGRPRQSGAPVVTLTTVPPVQDEDASRPWWPLRRRRNLAVVVVGAFVLGAIASAGIASLRPDAGAVTSAPSASPTRSTPGFDADQNGQEAVGPGGEPDAQPTEGAVTRAGDARAALKWFDGKQTEADKTTGIGPLVSSKGVPVDPASTRLVQTTSVASVWVAMGTPSLVNTFCLIIGNAEERSWGTSCANAVDFTSVGLQLVYPSPVPAEAPLTAVWTGTDITVSFGPG
ncbi:hypothetical protein [Glaciihabitans sp. dw_435]|uniref:hypothetical protein n=1 Tax=Glaciihabitans sp. dw_435 TaxID=2720081 RepID=UPI001BD654B7|nr:hypothetical protein [Glaciihabitans sp. dw_435]